MSLTKFVGRVVCLVLLAIVVYLLAVWAPRTANGDTGTTTTSPTESTQTVTVVMQAPTPPRIVFGYAGHSARYWQQHYAAARARARSLHRTLLHKSSVVEALNLACVVYGNCATLWRRARCESHLRALASNKSGAAGLLQFLASTWATTPFRRFARFSPYANALAAGWMIANGRGGEWVCR